MRVQIVYFWQNIAAQETAQRQGMQKAAHSLPPSRHNYQRILKD